MLVKDMRHIIRARAQIKLRNIFQERYRELYLEERKKFYTTLGTRLMTKNDYAKVTGRATQRLRLEYIKEFLIIRNRIAADIKRENSDV
jgi:hypothetical protein